MSAQHPRSPGAAPLGAVAGRGRDSHCRAGRGRPICLHLIHRGQGAGALSPATKSPATPAARPGIGASHRGAAAGDLDRGERLGGRSSSQRGAVRAAEDRCRPDGPVTGDLTIAGDAVTGGTSTAAMGTVKSDQGQRDVQFRGRIMDTSTYPAATFTLTPPITLAPVPAAGAARTYTAHGNLTLRGQTRPVTFPLTAQRAGNTIKVSGSIPVTFATWGIPNPSFGPITTQDHGVLEFLLDLGHS